MELLFKDAVIIRQFIPTPTRIILSSITSWWDATPGDYIVDSLERMSLLNIKPNSNAIPI